MNSVIREFKDHAERLAHDVAANEVGEPWRVLSDGSLWKTIAAGDAAASLWNPLAGKKTIPIAISSFHEADATILAAFVGGISNTPGYAVDNSEAPGIRWNNAAAPDPVMTIVPMPLDMHPGSDLEVVILASKSGATLADAVTFDCVAYYLTVGALHDADADCGETSSAMTGDATAKTVQRVTATIDAADLSSPPAALALSIQPTDGTLGTDDVTMHAVYIEYDAAFA